MYEERTELRRWRQPYLLCLGTIASFSDPKAQAYSIITYYYNYKNYYLFFYKVAMIRKGRIHTFSLEAHATGVWLTILFSYNTNFLTKLSQSLGNLDYTANMGTRLRVHVMGFGDTPTQSHSSHRLHLQPADGHCMLARECSMYSSVPSISATRGDDVKCRPFRKKMFCRRKEFHPTRQNF